MKIPDDAPFTVEMLDGSTVKLDGVDTSLQLASALTGSSTDDESLKLELAFWREKLKSPSLSSTQALHVSREFGIFMADLKKNLPQPPSPKLPVSSDSSPTNPPTP